MAFNFLVSWLQNAQEKSESSRPRRRRHAAPAVQQLEVRQLLAATGAPQIDIQATKIEAPQPSAVRGTSFYATTAMQNNGTSASGNVTVSYYLSTNSIISTADTLLKTVTRPSLAAGASSQWTELIAIPANTSFGDYYLGIIVDSSNSISETNESNNTRASVTPLRVTSSTELYLWEVTAPSTARQGTSIDVWTGVFAGSTVSGMTATGNYSVSYYLSTNSTISTADQLLKTVSKTVSGRSRFVETISLPSNLAPGTYYVGVILDAENAVSERNESDNAMAASTTITITSTPTIDLTPTLVDAASTGVHGSPVNVSMQVRNNGNTASGSYYVEYYLSTDSTITKSDTLVKQVLRTGLAAGGVQDWVESITTPSNLPTGNYYIGALVDALGQITETNEANNTAADSIQMKAWVDLSVSSTFSSEWVFPGESADIHANFNVSGFHPTGPFTINYYLSTNRTITTSDILLKSVTHPGVTGSKMWFATERVAIPANLAAGDYYVGVLLDPLNQMAETNETNNAVAGEKVTVVSRRPDLVSHWVGLPTVPSAPQTASAGSTIQVSAYTGNFSPFATGAYTVGFYLSSDDNITTSDILVKTVSRPGIAGRQNDYFTDSLTLPDWLAAGTYYVGIIADPFNAIAEANEAFGNASVYNPILNITRPTTIDLDPFNVDAPSTAVRGSTISVATDIENKGNTASGAYTVNYYISTDATITAGDTLLKSVSRSSIAGQSRQQWSESVTIPAGLAAGNYFIGVIVDPSNGIGETNESNNAQADGTAIAITLPGTIDLEAAKADAPTAAARGDSIGISTQVNNRGTGASGTYTVNYYLSFDSTITASDILVKTVTNRPGIAGGASSAWTESVILPAGMAGGEYFVGIIVDPSNAIAESNESNNVRSDSLPVLVESNANPNYKIDLQMTGSWSATQMAMFREAALHWQQIIIGDLPDVIFNGVLIDDLQIRASAISIDGAGGTLARAAADAFRTTGTKLAAHGFMEFDTADLASMEARGNLASVIMHEMGHILGLNASMWMSKNLMTGFDSADPRFTGTQAIAQYNAIFGTNATSVPLEGNNSAVGSRNSHWRESVFDHELMTPYVEAADVAMPISRVTVGALADMGYLVRMTAADPYTKPASSSAASAASSSTQTTGRPASLVAPLLSNAVGIETLTRSSQSPPCTCSMCVALATVAATPATYPSLTPTASAGSQNALAVDSLQQSRPVSGISTAAAGQGRETAKVSTPSDFWGLSCDDSGVDANRQTSLSTTSAAGAGMSLQQLFGQLRSEDLWAMPV